ncbi:AraC family transcriptional regulator [soil metagenome]
MKRKDFFRDIINTQFRFRDLRNFVFPNSTLRIIAIMIGKDFHNYLILNDTKLGIQLETVVSKYTAMKHAINGSKEVPLNIQAIESMEDECLQSAAKPGWHRHFEVLYIVKGKGICLIDLEKFEISDNMILCLRPDQVRQFKANGDILGYRISFTESFFNVGGEEDDLMYQSAIIESIPRSACVVLQDDITDDMKEILKKMIKEFDNDCLFRTEMLQRYLKIFLVYVARQFEDSIEKIIQTTNIEMAQKFKTLVDKNYITIKTVAEYAAMLFVTPNYLNTVVKKMTGYSARYHIRQRIVMEAKRKATHSGLCMKEIAYYLGFMDISHFSKYFKNATGINFSDFKKERYLMQIAD